MSTTTESGQASAADAPRSTFVSVVGWIFIVLSGFATLIAILQNIMIGLVFPMHDMAIPTVDPRTGKDIPSIFQFLFHHFQLVFLAFLIVSVATFVAAIGLLRRKNWARILFIGVMALGIAWNASGVLMIIPMSSMFSDITATARQPGFADHFDLMWKIMAGVNVLIAAVITWLFGWIIKRLVSESVRREFTAR